MIALLTGLLVHKAPDFIVLDVHGVGYRVQIPFSTYYDLPEPGGNASLQIYTHVKEDAIQLYGFRTLAEKELFKLLISVSGIGPKLAINILSNIEAPELSQAILRGDLARLSAIPGIGRKTAERLVLELKEKLKKLAPDSLAQLSTSSIPRGEVKDDVVSALVNLGYKEPQVQKVLDSIPLGDGESVELLLKRALKVLMK
ncbi:MAG TPA: Holliday junction branch migration protein RuvA [Geobacterales bacterium]|nr:Holliday junction branch migration protein RuvA [Geobacterales bacterium]